MLKKDEIAIPRPPGCCDKCIEQAAAASDAMIAVYCRHTQTGAWMRKVNGDLVGRWTALSPIGADEFVEFMDRLIADHVVDARMIM